ncbi:MAG: bifunctional riboflavin kinase/FAD synthetase, partial [Ferruginibacter sp.]
MPVHHNIHSLPAFTKPVITIGTFDGVHLGHVEILRQLCNEAQSIDGTAIVITFYPHPRQVIEKNEPIFILNTPDEKYALLLKHGVEHIICVPFEPSFYNQTAKAYIENFLVEKFHPHTIIIGYDHKFGSNREGGYHLLEEAALQYGFVVKEIPEHVLQNVVISSTRIREALKNGDIESANDFLGYHYFLSGNVVNGKRIGRTLGYPTANLKVQDEAKLIPSLGIYAVFVRLANDRTLYQGMLSIGTNPTLGGAATTIEVNIFEFNKDIYGELLTLYFVKKLRNEEKFDNLQ